MNKTAFTGLLGAGLATAIALPPAHGAQAPAAQPKTHVLFMGADLAVQREKKFYRVEDVVGSELKIKVGRKEVFVPTRNRSTSLKVDHSLKLAGASVKLDELFSGPAYTPANDPVRKMIAASGAAGGAAAVRDLAYGRMIAAEIGLASATNTLANTSESSASRSAVEAAYQAAGAEYEAGTRQAESGNDFQFSSQYDTAAYANKAKLEEAEGNYDAMEVSFKVSSPVELDDPHMVVLFKFQERDAKPGDEGMVIHAQSLEPIGPKPKYVRVRQGGLPRGFKYLDCEVHIFNRGEEVATNASSKRVELTREEARQYLLIEHLGANKGTTVPASAVRGTVPPTRLRELSLDQLNRTYYAKVGVDGVVLGLYADEACSLQLDDPVTVSIVGEVFFKPALYQGKPVPGVAKVRLGEI